MFFTSLKGLAVLFVLGWLAFVAFICFTKRGPMDRVDWWMVAAVAIALAVAWVLEAIQVRHNEKVEKQEAGSG